VTEYPSLAVCANCCLVKRKEKKRKEIIKFATELHEYSIVLPFIIKIKCWNVPDLGLPSCAHVKDILPPLLLLISFLYNFKGYNLIGQVLDLLSKDHKFESHKP